MTRLAEQWQLLDTLAAIFHLDCKDDQRSPVLDGEEKNF